MVMSFPPTLISVYRLIYLFEGSPFNISARKEVILSAGTVGSTQLLLLSGIGPAKTLELNNIPVVVNNPSVGANLTDHLLIPNVFQVRGNSLDGLIRDPTQQSQALAQWNLTKTGPFANSVANTYGFFRLPSSSSILAGIPDPAAGPNSPHFEMIPTVSFLWSPLQCMLKSRQNSWFAPGTVIPTTGNFLTIEIGRAHV